MSHAEAQRRSPIHAADLEFGTAAMETIMQWMKTLARAGTVVAAMGILTGCSLISAALEPEPVATREEAPAPLPRPDRDYEPSDRLASYREGPTTQESLPPLKPPPPPTIQGR